MKPVLLIIEDNESLRHFMEEICQKSLPNVEILTAADGDEGLRLAQLRIPGVIVLDIALPEMNGYEVCRQLKADPSTASIHVLMISGEMKSDLDRAHGIGIGADGYLLKPFNSAELLLQVQSLFRWWEAETKNRERLEGLVADRTATLMEVNGRLQQEVAQRKLAEADRDRLIENLQRTLSEVKTLRGLLPICAKCKKIRDDRGLWNQIEVYIHQHSEAQFTHSICPNCVKELYPELCPELTA